MIAPDQFQPPQNPVLPNARILIVDDEPGIRHTLAGLFSRMGYQVTEVASGEAALQQISDRAFDLVILDLNMPQMDGTDVLKAAQPVAPGTVFIILTGYGTLDSAILAIRHGAFDYLIKPSSVKEIVRAVEAGLAERERRLGREEPVALLERALETLKTPERPEQEGAATPDRFLQAGDVTVDTLRHLVVARGHPVDLTQTEFDILVYLIRHRDRVVSCREIVSHVRGYDTEEREARSLLRSHIHRLRGKVEQDPSDPSLIQTVRGSGYAIYS